MNFKETLEALKGKFSAKITAESTQEEIDEVNGLVAELDSLGETHEQLVNEHAKTKDALVRMVTNQGDGNKPGDDTDGSKPKTIEECVANELSKGGK